jgi:hypothetical protein
LRKILYGLLSIVCFLAVVIKVRVRLLHLYIVFLLVEILMCCVAETYTGRSELQRQNTACCVYPDRSQFHLLAYHLHEAQSDQCVVDVDPRAPALVLLMLFANSDLNGMIADVNNLNASKYEFKKL